MGVEMGLGFLLSLIAFLRAELGGRWAKEEILRVLADAKTVQAYFEWLRDNERDALVVGQPGAGKTELLHSLAQAKDAKFLLSDNPDIAAAALLAGPPSIVLVDDAGLRASLILRLRHLRIEQRLDFQIV